MKSLLLLLLKLYKLGVSPYLSSRCRYSPTCSEFAMDAINIHGTSTGSWLAFKRVIRCHPGRSPGYDPVPKK
ncbi:MAG: membrane protein insertion efficiency factor YidD [SAR202 cluster bacterium]|nr:membrane protein insertion efficiency factor YidD [Chloroflexota bacterium]MQG88966.1 membrane protein insertion efficiency factor YidD [SAR202 cluster bacterium]